MVEHLLAIQAFLFGHPPTQKKETDKLRPESENLKKPKPSKVYSKIFVLRRFFFGTTFACKRSNPAVNHAIKLPSSGLLGPTPRLTFFRLRDPRLSQVEGRPVATRLQLNPWQNHRGHPGCKLV